MVGVWYIEVKYGVHDTECHSWDQVLVIKLVNLYNFELCEYLLFYAVIK